MHRQNMNKILGLVFLPLLFIGCNLDNSDYPQRISFGSNGGTRIIHGDNGCHAIQIEDGEGHVKATSHFYGEEPYDSFIVEYDWLQVRDAVKNNNQLTITAKPNKTGKSRHYYITGMVMDEGFTIKVIQAGSGF